MSSQSAAEVYRSVDWSEGQSRFAATTRLFTKKPKDWQGKKKPQERREEEDFANSIREARFQLRQIRSKCGYCFKWYKGTYEDDHYRKCKPKAQHIKEECKKCGKQCITNEHVCGKTEQYYHLDPITADVTGWIVE